MRKIYQILAFFFFAIPCFSQNPVGIPDIINYSKDSYNAGPQNRTILQDRNGNMYTANTEGVLIFDGTYWKLLPLSNKTMVRSIAFGDDNRLYAGGQNEIGYFAPDQRGILTYTSLKNLIAEKYSSFKDVWDIISFRGDMYFRCQTKIFRLHNNAITVYPAFSEWEFLGVSNNVLFAQDAGKGLCKLINDDWTPLFKDTPQAPDFRITALISTGKDSTLVITFKKGLYVLSGNNISPFRFRGKDPFVNDRIMSAMPVRDNVIAIGTHLGGCYFINKQGDVIQNLSRKEGLQNNTILSLFLDKSLNVWLGLDNGVDCIAYNNSIKHIYPEKGNEGSGYSSIIFNNDLYIGTSNCLYTVPLSGTGDLSLLKDRFQPVLNTKGPCWGLYELAGKLLLAHHEGAYLIKNNTALPINNHTGYWSFVPFHHSLSPLLLAGNYNGIDVIQSKQDSLTSKGNLSNFTESSRFLFIDDNNTIWMAHTYKGVFKLDLGENSEVTIKLYTEKNGLPSCLNNHLFQVKNRIVVATEKGLYEYNAATDLFEESSAFGKLFGKRNIRYLKDDSVGNIWFIEDKRLGLVDFSDGQPHTEYFPELNGKIVSGFENIYPYNNSNIFVGAEKGFYHINYNQYRQRSADIQTRIRSVRASGKTDSLLFGGYFGQINEIKMQPKNAIPKIDFHWNSLQFEYSSPLYELQSDVLYSYFLKGFDKSWSGWSKKTEKDYTNLPPGDYMFQVKSKSTLEKESEIHCYSFIILPPWYSTRLAYFVYTLIFVTVACLIYIRLKKIFRMQQQKHTNEQSRLQYLHQLEMEKSEKEIIKLKNENLQVEIEYKNTELASVAMHLVQKGELLSKIKEELVRLKKNSNGDKPSEEFRKMIRILNDEDKIDNDWEQFAVHFDKLHSDFLKALKHSYQNLSATELKLCAYLRMNLSSKEVAQLMKISVRGVEISRYRLRKKLQISTETNLFDFLLRFPLQQMNVKTENV